MNAAYLSAFSALLGSAIGAAATFATTWLTQHHQDIVQRRMQESSRREQLYGLFIEESSKLFAEALTMSMESPGRLVMLYSILGKMRLFASEAVLESAQDVMRHILRTFRGPNYDLRQQPNPEGETADILKDFTARSREDLSRNY